MSLVLFRLSLTEAIVHASLISAGPIDPGVTLNRSLSETKAFGNVAKVESSTEPSLSLKGILHLGQLPIDPVSERFTDLNIDIWNISGICTI